MQKIIKRYLCVLMLLGTMMGYGQDHYAECELLYKVGTSDYDACRTRISEAAAAEAAKYVTALDEVVVYGTSSDSVKAAFRTLMLALETARLMALAKVGGETEAQAIAKAQADAIEKMQADGNGGNPVTPLENVTVTSTPKIYFSDNDHDGWYGSTSTTSGAGWSTSKGAGLDCNDSDPTKNYDCSIGQITGWYLDNDGDGYFAAVQPSATRPTPGNWTTTQTKGPDCNDAIFSLDNSVCVAPTPPPTPPPPTPPDLCAQIKAQIANAAWIKQLNILKGKTGLKQESGYAEELNAASPFVPLTASGNDHLIFPTTINTIGFMHTHLDPYQITNPDGEVGDVKPIHMFSPADVTRFMLLVVKAFVNHRSTKDVYGVMTSSTGTYELKFTGDVTTLGQIMNGITNMKTRKIEAAYKKAIDRYENEGGLLDFIQNTFKINGLELLKIENDNSVSKITKGTDGKGVKTPCGN